MDILFWVLVIIAILIVLIVALFLYVSLLPIDFKIDSDKSGYVLSLAVSVIQGIIGVRYALDDQGQSASFLLLGRPIWVSKLGPLMGIEEEKRPEEEREEIPKEPERKEPIPGIDEIESSYSLYVRPSTYEALTNPEAYRALLSLDTLKVLLDPKVQYRVWRIVEELYRSFSIEQIDLKTTLGSENPETMGLLYGYSMAIRGMLYPFPNLNLQVDPYFDRNILEWRLKTWFRVSLPITIYIAVLQLFLERRVLDLIHKMVIAGKVHGERA